MLNALPNNQAGFQLKVFSIGRTNKIRVECNMNIKRVSTGVTTIASVTTEASTKVIETTTEEITTTMQTNLASTTQEKIDNLLLFLISNYSFFYFIEPYVFLFKMRTDSF